MVQYWGRVPEHTCQNAVSNATRATNYWETRPDNVQLRTRISWTGVAQPLHVKVSVLRLAERAYMQACRVDFR